MRKYCIKTLYREKKLCYNDGTERSKKEKTMEQRQEVQVEEGINLFTIFKLLLSKIKYLILALLIGSVIGASFAVWKTIDVRQYGTKVEFYVNPEKARDVTDEGQYGVYGAYSTYVMDSMIKLLSSERFAEEMLLNGNALPDNETGYWTASEEEKNALNQKIAQAQVLLDKVSEENAEYNARVEEQTEQSKAYDEANRNLNREWAGLLYLKKVQASAFNEVEYDHLAGDDYNDLRDYYAKMRAAKQLLDDADEAVARQEKILGQALDAADTEREQALELWRQTARYKRELAMYSNALTFSYVEGEKNADTGNVACSFIYVNIFVLNDEAFAKNVLERVKVIVPSYVEARMTVPDGYTDTKCQRITTTDEIRRLNEGYTFNQAVKYGALVGVIALVIACAVVLIVDKADKRLRDISIITKQFNIPVLGLIPSIEEMEREDAQRVQEEEVE